MTARATLRSRYGLDELLWVVALIAATLSLPLPLPNRNTADGPWALAIAWQWGGLIIAAQMLVTPAPRRALRLVLLLSVLGSTMLHAFAGLGTIVIFKPLAATRHADVRMAVSVALRLGTQAVAALLLLGLPGVSTRKRSQRAGSIIVLVAVAAFVFIATFYPGTLAVNLRGDDAKPWFLGVSAVCATFGVWSLSRVRRTPGANYRRWSMVAVSGALVGFLASLVVTAFSATPPVRLLSIAGNAVLPLIAIIALFREYWVSLQTRSVSAILNAQESPADLQDALRSALGNPELRLALSVDERGGFVDPAGREMRDIAISDPQTLPVRVENKLIAAIDLGRADTPATSKAGALAGVAALAIEKAQLQARVLAQMNDVAESRRRLVDATDSARRSVERDLHDGAQQRLATLALSLRLAAKASPSSAVAQLAQSTSEELLVAIAELQDLARGIHPAVVSDLGLYSAVEALVDRAPFPVTFSVTSDRFTPTVELAAYYVIAESLTNIAKHVPDAEARVHVAVDGNYLAVHVTDHGPGGATFERGSGLQGLADRVAAVGGEFSLQSSLGDGTGIIARLPTGDDTAEGLK